MPRANSLFVLSTVATLTSCGQGLIGDEPDADPVPNAAERIVGGEGLYIPAVGALTQFGSPFCTATLVEPRKVVTAAHCLDGFNANRVQFVSGPSMSDLRFVIDVTGAAQHPNWNRFNLSNDIGYVTLAQDAPVAPLAVVDNMTSAWEGRELLFVGYGVSNGRFGSGGGVSRGVVMPIDQVGATQFSYSVPGRNTCNGDSGGPAFYQNAAGDYLVAGVTSYGDASCTQFGVDTRVDVYLDFLDIDATPTGPEPDPCAGETFEGRCDNNVVVWCENNAIQESNCSSRDLVCGFSQSDGYYACVGAPVDPCEGETFEGRCDGGAVIWCENDEVKSINCTNRGASCGFDSGKGFYNCL